MVAGETSVNTTDNAIEAPAAASEPAAEVDPKKAAIAAAIARPRPRKPHRRKVMGLWSR